MSVRLRSLARSNEPVCEAAAAEELTRGGSSIDVISSSAARLVSCCGVSPGSRWKSAMGISRSPREPVTRTFASSTASATHMSDGCTAMHASLVPRIAFMRLRPPMAEQPEPGSRLLQGVAVS